MGSALFVIGGIAAVGMASGVMLKMTSHQSPAAEEVRWRVSLADESYAAAAKPAAETTRPGKERMASRKREAGTTGEDQDSNH